MVMVLNWQTTDLLIQPAIWGGAEGGGGLPYQKDGGVSPKFWKEPPLKKHINWQFRKF